MRIPVTTLNDGYDLPLLGLGTYKLQGEDVERTVRTAIELGYRHIDTASLYGNEVEVGKAVNGAIKAGGCHARGTVHHHQAVERRPGACA